MGTYSKDEIHCPEHDAMGAEGYQVGSGIGEGGDIRPCCALSGKTFKATQLSPFALISCSWNNDEIHYSGWQKLLWCRSET